MRAMDLIWASYTKKDGKQSIYLLVYLGEYAGRTITLNAKEITDKEITKIRAKVMELRSSDLKGIIRWIKDECPSILERAKTSKVYLSFDTKRLRVQNNYGLRGTKSV